MVATSILIVDDNIANIELLEYLLIYKKFEVKTASNADKALQILKNFKPSLILMDLQMPGTSGLELLKLLRKNPQFNDICIIAVTSFAMQGDAEKALSAGFNGYITKPINVQTLPGVIEQYLAAFRKTHSV